MPRLSQIWSWCIYDVFYCQIALFLWPGNIRIVCNSQKDIFVLLIQREFYTRVLVEVFFLRELKAHQQAVGTSKTLNTEMTGANVNSNITNNSDTNNTANNKVTGISNSLLIWIYSFTWSQKEISTGTCRQQEMVITAANWENKCETVWLCNCERIRSYVHQLGCKLIE